MRCPVFPSCNTYTSNRPRTVLVCVRVMHDNVDADDDDDDDDDDDLAFSHRLCRLDGNDNVFCAARYMSN